jgi:outer membrane protein
MKLCKFFLLVVFYFFNITGSYVIAQPKVWTVDDCIKYALDKNIQVQKAKISYNINEENLKYAKSAMYPSLNGSARQNFDWANQLNTTSGSTVFTGTNGTNISISSAMTVYNGSKLQNSVKKSETDYEAA